MGVDEIDAKGAVLARARLAVVDVDLAEAAGEPGQAVALVLLLNVVGVLELVGHARAVLALVVVALVGVVGAVAAVAARRTHADVAVEDGVAFGVVGALGVEAVVDVLVAVAAVEGVRTEAGVVVDRVEAGGAVLAGSLLVAHFDQVLALFALEALGAFAHGLARWLRNFFNW